MHFFIDQNNLTTQDPGDTYGPKQTCESTHYRVTSRFQLTNEANAYATCAGRIIVLPSALGSAYVNIILKPELNTSNTLNVDYFIYRGITKSSFFNSQDDIIDLSDPAYGTCEPVARFWEDPGSDVTATNFGYYSTNTHDSKSIEEIFNDNITNLTAFCVVEGEILGQFTNAATKKIGFEVVIDKNKFPVTISYVKLAEGMVNVSGFSGVAQKIEREKILCFMDPAAFYGYHSRSDKGYIDPINYKSTSTSTTSSKTVSTRGSSNSVYKKLLSKFYTKNRIYLDIRNEEGYSFDFHRNDSSTAGFELGTTVANLGNDNDADATNGNDNLGYSTKDWPIIFDMSTVTGSGNARRKFYFRLKTANTTTHHNMLNFGGEFRHTPVSPPKGVNYYKGNALVDQSTTNWTVAFNYEGITTNDATNSIVSSYIKLTYYKISKTQEQYNCMFPSIDTNLLGASYLDNKSIINIDRVYVNRDLDSTTGFGNFEFFGTNGAYWDNNNDVIFYSKIAESPIKHSGKEFYPTFEDSLDLTMSSFLNSDLSDNLKTICRPYQWNTSPVETINIPGINYYNPNISGVGKHKENLMLLGLKKAEFDAIKDDGQLDNKYQRSIVLEDYGTNPHTDSSSNNMPHFIYRLRLKGYAVGASVQSTITPTTVDGEILLHSRDNMFFSSEEFCKTQSVSDFPGEDHRVECHIFNDGKLKINDNIDLSNVLQHYSTTPANRKISYLYHFNSYEDWLAECNSETCSPADPTFIDSLELVMSNKMKRLSNNNSGIIGSVPSTYTSSTDWSVENVDDVSAYDSYYYANGDIVTTGENSTRKYIKDGNYKIYMVKLVNTSVTTTEVKNSFEFIGSGLDINIKYDNTVRHYGHPMLAGAVIGAVVELGEDITSEGLGYIDGASYPSYYHVNGLAMDIHYMSTTNNVNFILALYRFGFNNFRIGNSSYPTCNNINNHASIFPLRRSIIQRDGSGSTLHGTHLHYEEFVIKE